MEGKAKEEKWVLIVNRNPGAPAGGTGVEYFVGTFDGFRFTPDSLAGKELWADYGKDFYATNTFADLPAKDARKIWIGWISNWQYANREPTRNWRGAQSLPRELSLRRLPEGLRLVQRPIAETKTLRTKQLLAVSRRSVAAANEALRSAHVAGDALEIEAELLPEGQNEIGFLLRKSATEQTILGFAPASEEVYVDRSRSGEVSFAPEFAGRFAAQVPGKRSVKLHAFLDRSSLEVFVNDGEAVLTNRIYPSPGGDGVEIFSGAQGKVLSLSIWKLGSVWR